MTPAEVVANLRVFNDWRRGELDDLSMPDPREIGEAIDAAVEMIERMEKHLLLILEEPENTMSNGSDPNPYTERSTRVSQPLGGNIPWLILIVPVLLLRRVLLARPEVSHESVAAAQAPSPSPAAAPSAAAPPCDAVSGSRADWPDPGRTERTPRGPRGEKEEM